MATATETENEDYVDFDQYIDFQVNRTRSQIRSTDLMAAAAGGVSIVLAYLLVFVVLDHWFIPGGFSSTMRWFLLAGVIAIIGGWTWLRLSKPYFSKVSRLFAARELEDASDEMRSSLITLVDLRDNKRTIQPEIQDALQKRAVKNLSTMDVEEAIDRKSLLQVFYMLLAVVLIFCSYAIFSPKKISTSIWRALLPVASIEVPTKTTIVDVDPGDHNVLARSLLDVSVYLSGDIPDEVTLYYTTDDRRYVDEPVLMREVKDVDGKFTCLLSGENGRGLLQNHSYRIVAGDAESGIYKISVKQAPIATINSLELEFPKYMDLPPRRQSSGDIDAWEGTIVELKATASMPVKSAIIRLSDSEDLSQKAEEIPLKITNGKQLSARWRPLEFRTDGSYPKYYRIECRNEDGDTDPSPSLYHLKIRPDQSPEVKLLAPRQDITRPSNAIVPMIIRAHDPDFKLRYLTLRIEKDGEPIFSEPIFDGIKKQVTLTHDLRLESLRLKTDDEITFWVEARDNKQPLGNRKNSTRLKILIVDPLPTAEEVQKDFEKTKEQQIQDLIQQGEDTEGVEEDANKKENMPPEEKTRSFPEPKETDENKKDNSSEDKNKSDENSENSDGKSDENSTSDSMKGSSSEQNGDKSQDSGSQSKSSPDGKTGEEKLEPVFNTDGSDDDAVLEKMIRDELEKQRKENEQKQNKDSSNENDDKQNPNNNPSNTKTPNSDNKESMNEPSKDSPNKESNPVGKRENKDKETNSGPDKNEKSDNKESSDENSQKMNPDGSNEKKSNDPNSNNSDENSKDPNSNNDKSSENKPDEMKSDRSENKDSTSKDSKSTDKENSENAPSQKSDANKDTPNGLNDKKNEPGSDNKSAEKSDSKSDQKSSEKMNPDGKQNGSKPSENKKQEPKENTTNKPSNKSNKPSNDPAKPASKENQKPGDKKSSKTDPNGKKSNEPPKNSKGNPQDKLPKKNPSEMKPGDPRKSDNKSPIGNKPPEQKPNGKKNDGKKSDSKKSDNPKGEKGKPSDKKSDSGKKSEKGKEGDGKKPGQGNKPGDKPGKGKPEEGKGGSKKPGDGKGKGDKPGQGKGKPAGGKPGGTPKGSGEPTEDGKKSNGGSGMSRNIPERNDGKHTAGGHGNAKEDANARPEGSGGTSETNTPESLEDRKKAANLVLKKMEENSKEANDKLLKELGWTEKQLADFRERMSKHLKQKKETLTQEEIVRKRQFEEMLKNMDLKQTKPAEIQGGKFEKSNIDSFAPGGKNAPPQYRELEEAFKRSLSKKRNKN